MAKPQKKEKIEVEVGLTALEASVVIRALRFYNVEVAKITKKAKDARLTAAEQASQKSAAFLAELQAKFL